jgi:hypothetical protein
MPFKDSSDTIGNPTRDLPACRAVAPFMQVTLTKATFFEDPLKQVIPK